MSTIKLYSSNDKQVIYQDELELIYDTRVWSKELSTIRLECDQFEPEVPYLIQITRYRKNNMQEAIFDQYPLYAYSHIIEFSMDSKEERAFQSGRWHLRFKILVQSSEKRFESKIFQRWKTANPKQGIQLINLKQKEVEKRPLKGKKITKKSAKKTIKQQALQEIELQPVKDLNKKDAKLEVQPLATSTRKFYQLDGSFNLSIIQSNQSKILVDNKRDSIIVNEISLTLDDSSAFLIKPKEQPTQRKSIMNLIYPIEGLKGMSRWIGGFFNGYSRSN